MRTSQFLSFLVLGSLLLGGGISGCPYTPRPVDPRVGAGCTEACDHAKALGCPELITPRVGTCEEACENYERNGGDYCTDFLVVTKSCDELRQVAEDGCEQ